MFWPSTQRETAAGSSPADLEQGASRPDRGSDPVSEATPAAVDAEQGRLMPSEQMTRHQLFYVLMLDGVGGMLLSGGVNFALAYAMYTTQDTAKNPVRLFQLPNTLAGDAAVTIFVQCILTWFVEKGLVAYDLDRRSVQPMGFVPEPTLRWQRWFFFLPTSVEEKGEVVTPSRLASLLQQALRGLILAVFGFLLLWPAGVGVLTALGQKTGGDYTYADRWTPQVFKFVLGGLLGLFTTPLMAAFWLVKAGWEVKAHHLPKDI
ncbi:hypothetical protein B0J13DRAFT_678985 [Dactylonectria estremocensis]|uniref:Uncharacterized protein n=1 Tax=Dactylonectria estremocensis TaxID=1079267 RepID=A0A9P9IQZ9_9HYPO|nr:hypothetical protein B0J13DRAFT_678985 [Dactylonectria estremocensis]